MTELLKKIVNEIETCEPDFDNALTPKTTYLLGLEKAKEIIINHQKQVKSSLGDVSGVVTCGKRDENGFCDTYVDGKKSDVRLFVFTENEATRLLKIMSEVQGENRSK